MSDDERIVWIDQRIDQRIDHILFHPAMWGSFETVEQLVLQLIEFKALLKSPSEFDSQAVLDDYREFLKSTFRDGQSTYAVARVSSYVEIIQVLRDYLTAGKFS